MTPARILIVEDESIVALDLFRSLESLGYQVVGQVARGQDALRAAENLRPDLVLMDIRLKGEMDGIEAADHIRTRFDIPVIFLTAHSDQNTIQRARVTEPFGYILKPFDERELDSNISIALYKHLTEQKLRQSEEKYRTLFETMAQGVVYQDAAGRILSANPAAERILGLSLGQMQGLASMDPRWMAIYPDGSDFPGDRHPAMVALQTGQEVRNVVMGVFNPVQEEYVWISVNARPLFSAGMAKPDQVFTTFEDITDIQKAEALVQASEEKYRGVIEHSTDAIILVNDHGIVVEWNEAAEQINGLPKIKALNQNLWDIFYQLNPEKNRTPEVYDSLKANVLGLLASRQIPPEYQQQESIIQHEDGTIRTVQSHNFTINSKNGFLMASIQRDITERKHAEEVLHASETRYRTLVETSPDAITLIDLQGHYLMANQQALKLYGVNNLEEMQASEVTLFDHVPEPDRPHLQEKVHKAVRENAMQHIEYVTRLRDGSSISLETTLSVMTDAEDQPYAVLDVSRDITERKKAEAELHKLSLAVTQSANVIVITDADGRIEYVNPKFEEVTGYSAEEAHGQNPRILKSGEQTPDFYQYLWSTIKSGKVWRGEFHNKRKDGSFYWEGATIAPIAIDHGPITHFIAVKEDITSRKAIEAAEHEQRQLAEALRNTAEALTSTLKFDDVLERILDNIGRVVPYDAVGIILINGQNLQIVRHRGWVERGGADLVNRSDLSVEDLPGLQSMYATREMYLVFDIPMEEQLSKIPETHWVRSVTGVPITIREQVVGFLILSSATPNFYNKIYADRLKAFASQAAIAIENARLYEQTHYYSITDGLTGLYNGRHFNNLADFEIQRVVRYHGNLSLALLDLDQLKLFNDTYGHPVGDEVLRQVVAHICNNLRKSDVAARYGGDEFVILMVETGLIGAYQVAERIRKSIAEAPIRVDGNPLTVTISAGVATICERTQTLRALIKCADDALYTAKAAGRNRVALGQ